MPVKIGLTSVQDYMKNFNNAEKFGFDQKVYNNLIARL